MPIVPAHPRIAPRFFQVAFGGGITGFLIWCALDSTLVTFARAHIHRFDWVLLLFPFAVGFAGAAIFRQSDTWARVGLAILAAIVASVVAVALFLFLGISFHFAIGGN